MNCNICKKKVEGELGLHIASAFLLTSQIDITTYQISVPLQPSKSVGI